MKKFIKTKQLLSSHLWALTLINGPLLAISAVAIATNVNRPQQALTKPQSLFKQPFIPLTNPNLSFQANVNQLINNAQLAIQWKFQISPNLNLVKQFINQPQALLKAFTLVAIDQSNQTWSDDLLWKLQIKDVQLNQNQSLDVEFEVIETDLHGFATGASASIKQNFKIDQTITNQAYQDQVLQASLNQWRLKPDYRHYQPLQFISAITNIDRFSKTIMEPINVLGLDQINYQIDAQVVKQNLTIKVNQFEKTWSFPTDQNTILIKDFKTNHNLLKSDSNLLLINDNRRAKLDLNLDLSQFNFLKVDLSAYLNVFAGDQLNLIANQLVFNPDAKLKTANYPQHVAIKTIKLPNGSPNQISLWQSFFNRPALISPQLDQSQTTQLLVNQWFQNPTTLDWTNFEQSQLNQYQTSDQLIEALLAHDFKTIKIGSVNPTMPYFQVASDQIKRRWLEKLATVKTVIIDNQHPLELLDLEPFMAQIPNATFIIDTNVFMVKTPIFRSLNNNYFQSIQPFRGQIKRTIHPDVLAKIKNNTIDVNRDFSQYLTYNGPWLNMIFNSFDLAQNKILYQNVNKIKWSNYAWFGTDNSYFAIWLRKQLAFLIDLPSWLISDQLLMPLNQLLANNPDLSQPIIKPIELDFGDISLNENLLDLMWIYTSEWNRFSEQKPWLATYGINYHFSNKQKRNDIIDANGVLNYQAYLQQFDPNDWKTTLIGQGQYIKKIDLTNVETIKAKSLMMIDFATPVTIDLAHISSVETQAFSGSTNLTITNAQSVLSVSAGAFSAIESLTIDLATIKWSTIPEDCFRGTTLKLSSPTISSQVQTIGDSAFLGTSLSFTNPNQPLDLTHISAIEFNAFSYNPDLNYVKTGPSYWKFQGFEHSGLKSFDFHFIETIGSTTQRSKVYYEPASYFNLSQFSDKTLDFSSFDFNALQASLGPNKIIDFNLPSVQSLIWNPNLNEVDPSVKIVGFENLKTITNYRANVNPNYYFKNLKTPLSYYHEGQQFDPTNFGYDPTTNSLDWSVLDQIPTSKAKLKWVYQAWDQLAAYFKKYQIIKVKRWVLPQTFFINSEEHFYENGIPWYDFNERWADVIKPIFKIETLASAKTSSQGTYDTNNVASQLLKQFKIDQIAGDFILNLNWNIVPYAYFKDWQVANQSEPIVLPTELDMINAYAFSNSGLKTFVWSDPTQNNYQRLQIDNYAFDQDVTINLNLNTTIALKAFSQSDQIANTITFNQQPIQAWIKPYYDEQNQILNLSTINRFDLGLLRLLIIAFQDRDLRVLKLPALNEVDRAWFTIANHVDQLIINQASHIIGTTGINNISYLKQLARFDQILAPSVVLDYLDIIK